MENLFLAKLIAFNEKFFNKFLKLNISPKKFKLLNLRFLNLLPITVIVNIIFINNKAIMLIFRARQ